MSLLPSAFGYNVELGSLFDSLSVSGWRSGTDSMIGFDSGSVTPSARYSEM